MYFEPRTTLYSPTWASAFAFTLPSRHPSSPIANMGSPRPGNPMSPNPLVRERSKAESIGAGVKSPARVAVVVKLRTGVAITPKKATGVTPKKIAPVLARNTKASSRERGIFSPVRTNALSPVHDIGPDVGNVSVRLNVPKDDEFLGAHMKNQACRRAPVDENTRPALAISHSCAASTVSQAASANKQKFRYEADNGNDEGDDTTDSLSSPDLPMPRSGSARCDCNVDDAQYGRVDKRRAKRPETNLNVIKIYVMWSILLWCTSSNSSSVANMNRVLRDSVGGRGEQVYRALHACPSGTVFYVNARNARASGGLNPASANDTSSVIGVKPSKRRRDVHWLKADAMRNYHAMANEVLSASMPGTSQPPQYVYDHGSSNN
ncbi:hypothetical protein BV22DRAFT_1051050 [Leucogyrophana mollusca]|uniref:Uncharacterized protein n=1 Tax=Leucogyrophana mollusca TaxID=85980 RepID=A0ACB8B3X2_9AGAM|nr:hypothetical protein BV22DRAFT_1051050 [Leucogyrophana mollusca]